MNGWKIILAYVLGWFVAQTTKYVLLSVKGGTKGKSGVEKFRMYVKSGGMPSGHTGSILGAATYAGLAYGFDSVAFGILVCFSATVIYDAVNVRYAVGEQGKKMNKLIKVVKPDDTLVRVVEGHTGVEVLVGGVIGVAMGSLVFLIFK
ncbi:divergent PAP2 family protein [Candidatus Saccharibacteria bacterium]|nr:divergent PAP2 family protein [Candidatus Saccharibacteria bacterium]